MVNKTKKTTKDKFNAQVEGAVSKTVVVDNDIVAIASQIFISYSRKDMDFASKVVQALADKKIDTWIDWKSIPKTVDWEQEIYHGIEETNAFIFMVSPESVRSEMCRNEIAHAAKNNKRIIPIVICDTDLASIPPAISKLNWIFCRNGQDDFSTAIEQARVAIHTDYEWLKYHTVLQNKALAWERQKDASRLLRGKELREAEQKLADAEIKMDPQPTNLQRQYILLSRREEENLRRRSIIWLSSGLVFALILAGFAVFQMFQAQKQSRIARVGEYAAIAVAKSQTQLNLSFLLSIEAFRELDNVQTRSTLLDTLQTSPHLRQILDSNVVYSVAFSPDGKILASGSDDTTIMLWNVETGQSIGQLLGKSGAVTSIAFSPDGKILASGNGDSTIIFWDVQTGQPIGQPIIGDKSGYQVTSVAFSPE